MTTRFVIGGMRFSFLGATVFSAVGLFGCAATPWTVIHEASPAPYGKNTNMTLEELSFDNLKVGGKTEEQFLASKTEEKQQSFLHDKAAMTTEFQRGFDAERGPLPIIPAGIPGSQAFVIKPHVTFIEPGVFTGTIISQPTEVRVTLDVLDPNGDLDDEIVIATKVNGSLENDPASGTRMREAAEEIGRDVAAYLKKRVGV